MFDWKQTKRCTFNASNTSQPFSMNFAGNLCLQYTGVMTCPFINVLLLACQYSVLVRGGVCFRPVSSHATSRFVLYCYQLRALGSDRLQRSMT